MANIKGKLETPPSKVSMKISTREKCYYIRVRHLPENVLLSLSLSFLLETVDLQISHC